MAQIEGLVGLRPMRHKVKSLTTPPYDVIKVGSPLEKVLKSNKDSLFHVILGNNPKDVLRGFIDRSVLQEEKESCYYVYEQNYKGQSRLGFFAAIAVDDYSEKNVIRHEKTFDDKVKGRIALAEKTQLTTEPIFLLTKSTIQISLEKVTRSHSCEYEFVSDFDGNSDLNGIKNRIFRISQDSEEGKVLQSKIAKNPLYIADGHHRYHAALLNNQTHTLAYIVQDAKILAYNRVIQGKVSFKEIQNQLNLTPCNHFFTPPKNSFCIYTREGSFLMPAQDIPIDDIVRSLDCSLLEEQLYNHLGITHDLILDQNHFDYYSEDELQQMQEQVDLGEYDIAVALHPVSIDELISVADAGLGNSNIVMPEKSTYFAPKILSGLFLYTYQKK